MNGTQEWKDIDAEIAKANAACDREAQAHIDALALLLRRTTESAAAFAECRKAWLAGTGAPMPVLAAYWGSNENLRAAEATVAFAVDEANAAERRLRLLLATKYDAVDATWTVAETDVKISEAYYMPKGGEK